MVEAPDGALVACCIGWNDTRTHVVAIEPLGVSAAHRNQGLAGALCLHVARLARRRGANEVVIHPRGDPAYPAARGAYVKAGFQQVGRTELFGLANTGPLRLGR